MPEPIPLSPIFPSLAAIQTVSVARATEEVTAPSTSEKPSLSQVKRQLSSPAANFEELSKNVWKELEKSPLIQAEIKKFSDTYPGMIEIMRGPPPISWQDLCAHHKELMDDKPIADGKSFEQFRWAAVAFLEKVVGIATTSLGIAEKPGHWDASSGTKGYKSDIDNPYFPDGQMSEENQMLVKTLADTFWTHFFGGLSGTQIELESYIRHPGLTRQSGKGLEDPKEKQNFSRLEIAMSVTEMRRAYADNPDGWKKYKANFLNKIKDTNPPLYEAYKSIFKDVDEFEKVMHKDIMAQIEKEYGTEYAGFSDKEQRYAYKKAALLYRIPRLINISAQMDELTKKKEELEKNLIRLKDKLILPKNEIKKIKSQIDRIEVQLASRAAIRNCLLDETYAAQATFIVICQAEGSQRTKTEKVGLARQQEVDQIRRQVSPLARTQARLPTAGELIISARENLAKARAKLEHSKGDIGNTSIEISKYTERTAQNCKQALIAMIEKYDKKIKELEKLAESSSGKKLVKINHDIEALKQHRSNLKFKLNQITQLHQTSAELEKTKRQFIISEPAVKRFLETITRLDDEQREEINKILTEVATDPEGIFIDMEPTLKEIWLMSRINKIINPESQSAKSSWRVGEDSLLEEYRTTTGIPELDKIIKARAGLLKNPQDIRQTLKIAILNLPGEPRHAEAVDKFLDELAARLDLLQSEEPVETGGTQEPVDIRDALIDLLKKEGVINLNKSFTNTDELYLAELIKQCIQELAAFDVKDRSEYFKDAQKATLEVIGPRLSDHFTKLEAACDDIFQTGLVEGELPSPSIHVDAAESLTSIWRSASPIAVH